MTGNCNSRARIAAPLPLLIWSALLLLCSKNLVPVTEAIWLSIPSTGTKCVSEEIHNNVVVLADYYVINEKVNQEATLSARVTTPYGNNFYHAENVTHGKFAFTTSEAGNYLACFWMDNHHDDAVISLSLDWKMGIATKDWDSVAKKEKIEGVELDLRRLEASVQAIHNNLIYLRDKEADMRAVSERTNGRVAWFSTKTNI